MKKFSSHSFNTSAQATSQFDYSFKSPTAKKEELKSKDLEPQNTFIEQSPSTSKQATSKQEKADKKFKQYPPILIHTTWLYSWPEILAGLMTTLLAVKLSSEHGILNLHISLPLTEAFINLPLLLLLPAYFFIRSLLKLCNIYASMDHKRLIFHKGFITLRHKMVEMETDTLQVVQVTQSPLGKLLNYGTVSVGRFSRKSLEFDIHGVKSPHLLIRKMRKKIKEARKRKSFLQNRYQGEFIDDTCLDEEKKNK